MISAIVNETIRSAGIITLFGISITALILFVLYAVGFTSGGIRAGSIAARSMSATAVNNGGSIAAGSIIAVLQSFGTFGMGSKKGFVAIALVAGAIAYICQIEKFIF